MQIPYWWKEAGYGQSRQYGIYFGRNQRMELSVCINWWVFALPLALDFFFSETRWGFALNILMVEFRFYKGRWPQEVEDMLNMGYDEEQEGE